MSYHQFYLLESNLEEFQVNNSDFPRFSPYNGYFLRDWIEKLGFGEKKTLKYLRREVELGNMTITKVPIKDITGRTNYSYIYLPKEE